MMRCLKVMLLLSAILPAPAAAQQAADRFELLARMREYGASLGDAVSWGGVAASTMIDQIGGNPDGWSLGDRALSNASRFVLEQSILHGVAAIQDRSTWYEPCACEGMPRRVAHAFAQAFTDRDRNGVPHVSAARVGATYGAAFAEALWRPDTSIEDAFVTGSTSLVISGLFNIVREIIAR
jgi:hypothetical protein